MAIEDALDVGDSEGVEDCAKETDALLDTLVLLDWLNEGSGDHVAIEDALVVRETMGLLDVFPVVVCVGDSVEVWEPVEVMDSMADSTGVVDGHADIVGMLLIESAIVYDGKRLLDTIGDCEGEKDAISIDG